MTKIFCDNDKCIMLNNESDCTADDINLLCNNPIHSNSLRCTRFEKI